MPEIAATDSKEPLGHTYAEPLSGLRISWGSLLAGTVATIAVSGILWALGLAIVATATKGNWSAIRGSMVALWIIAMFTTQVGAFVGGVVSGALTGNPMKRIGIAHAFTTWGLAFILSTAAGALALGSLTRTTAVAAVDATAAAVEATGAAAGGAAGANVPLSQRAEQTLTSLGYTPEQARTMVGKAQTQVQTANPNAAGTAVGSAMRSVVDTLIGMTVAIGWSWWGTWFVAMFLAMAGGAFGATRLRQLLDDGRSLREPREEERIHRPMGPLTPAPTP